jgi:hypothetical protein
MSDTPDPDPIYTTSPVGPVAYDGQNYQPTYFLVVIPFVGDPSCMHFDVLEEITAEFTKWMDMRSAGQFNGLLWAFHGQRVTLTPGKTVYDLTVPSVGTFEVSPRRTFEDKPE